ncbi:general stress protein [Pseudarthrobacter sp. H2]|uniref:general stress protein n=1 Tax=Pseudarthrobacter sp. H2 TaxID=3418415 RepID=UPI003CF2EACB
MSGTVAGGRKAAAKNLAQDPNFYAKIGAIGGANGNTGGFAANPDLARIAGAKGGRKSRRKKATQEEVTVTFDVMDEATA